MYKPRIDKTIQLDFSPIINLSLFVVYALPSCVHAVDVDLTFEQRYVYKLLKIGNLKIDEQPSY